MSEHADPTLAKHDLTLDGITLRYITWGAPGSGAPPVLLIHGITASHRSWAVAGPALAAQGYYVIAPDLRGRGLSAKPPHGYGIPFHVDDVLGLCDHLGFSNVDAVGHSLGAQIVLFMAALHPARVRRLVLVDGGGKTPDDAMEAVASSVRRVGLVFPSLDAYLDALRQAAPFAWTPFWDAYYRYDAEVHADGTVTARMPKPALDEEAAVLFATRTEALPPFVKAPTLIVRAALGTLGRDRGFILPAEEAERIRAAIPNCRIVEIPETNHYTVNQVEDFTRAVGAFLAEGA